MRDTLAIAFAGFVMLSRNSIGLAQKRIAANYAGNCLWALGIEEYDGIRAVETASLGDIIEGVPVMVINEKPPSQFPS